MEKVSLKTFVFVSHDVYTGYAEVQFEEKMRK